MRDDALETVRLRAYQIWIDEGRPEGQHESHWLRALEESGLAQNQAHTAEASSAVTDDWDNPEI
jgi:hypothetical protein